MALEATHIKFALQLKEKYQVKNLCEYVVGSVYPDSCNFTKIDRILTHNYDDFLKPSFTKDDFHKGWQVHLLVDKMWLSVRDEFSDLVKLNNHVQERVIFSAIKLIHDMKDAQDSEVQKNIKCLNDYCFNPNNENLERMEFFHSSIVSLYNNFHPQNNLMVKYKKFFSDSGFTDIVVETIEVTNSFLRDDKIMRRINLIHEEMLRRADLYLDNNN